MDLTEFRKSAKKGTPIDYSNIPSFWTDKEAEEMNMRSLRENRSLDDIMHEELKRKILRGELDTDLEKLTEYKQKKDVLRARKLKKINGSK
jgi:hypothetical protein